MIKKYYVYIHTKMNSEVFYVGKGCRRRAFTKHHRNNLWHYVARKGYNVIITDYYDSDKEAGDAETALVAEYRSLGCDLVNQTNGGDGGSSGRVWKKSTRKKLSEACKGEKNPMFGKTHSDDAKRKLSESNSGERNGFFGKHHSEETRAKLRKAWKKRRKIGVSDETRKKLSALRSGERNIMYGKKHSEKTKNKISNSMRGKKLSKSHKEKISKSRIGIKRKKYKKEAQISLGF